MYEKSGENKKLNILNACFSALIVLVIFTVISVVCRITPLGDNTFLMFDLKRQYVDYYAYLRTILSGENNITYSFSTTLGSGIFGFYSYYLTSPFILILAFFPQSAVPAGISMVICLKLMLAAFIMDLFLQKKVCSGPIAPVLGGVSWGLSGFLFAHSMNMMWIDVVMLLPLEIQALEFILERNRKLPYVVVLSAMLLLNYYISYQVLLFSALWTLMRIFVRNDEKKLLQILRVFEATVTAVLIDGVILLPTALQLIDSPKDITQLGLELKGQNLSIIDVMSKTVTLSYDYIEARFGYPQIFCGVLLVILATLYFVDRKIALREKIGMAVMFFILMLSFRFDILNLIWHAGMEPSGHPYRQAFLWTFLVVICAAKAFDNIKAGISLVKAAAVTCGLGVLIFAISRGKYDHISGVTVAVNALIAVLYFFVLTALALACRKKSEKLSGLLVILLVIMNCVDLMGNAVYTYHFQSMKGETASFYEENVRKNLEAVKYIKSTDSSFYRMETLNPRQQNDALQFDYNGVTHYSSAGMIYVRYFLQRIGFNDDTLYTHYGHDNTATADSLLGIKYVMSDGTYAVHPDYRLIHDGDEKVYENPWPLSVAVGTQDFDLAGISDPSDNYPDPDLKNVPVTDPFSLQEDVYSRLLGKKISIFAPASVEKSELLEVDGKFCEDYTVTAANDGELFFYLDGLIGAAEGLAVYVNDEFLSTYGNASCVKILNLGMHKAGDRIKVRVQAENKEDNRGTAYFVTEDTEALSEAFEEIEAGNCNIIKKSSSRLIIEAGDYNGVFVTIPFEKGWKIKVDGKEIQPVAVYDSLTYIPIDTDGHQHRIEMSFYSPGRSMGLVISFLGLGILLAIFFLEKKGDGHEDQ
ncbi:MAG: hypothetical protein E7307_12940 [Butyrivibrio sp.]|nr:hypothetical protein [Butyrivibrio sp.]